MTIDTILESLKRRQEVRASFMECSVPILTNGLLLDIYRHVLVDKNCNPRERLAALLEALGYSCMSPVWGLRAEGMYRELVEDDKLTFAGIARELFLDRVCPEVVPARR